MKFSEAIAILEMEDGSQDPDEGLARAYRVAMKKYHPDVTTLDPDFALEMSKLVNEAYSFLSQNMGKWKVGDKGDINISDVMAEVYNKIRHIPFIKIERLGIWLWVTVDGPPEYQDAPGDTVEGRLQKRKGLRDFRKGVGSQLKEHGFKYAPKKQKWSWHSISDSPKRWKRKAWEWSKIKATFDGEELETAPHQAVA